jgi:hypothetical protein
MFSERGQRIPGWAPVKQWTEGPTALRRRLGHRPMHCLDEEVERNCGPLVQALSESPGVNSGRNALASGPASPHHVSLPTPPYPVGVLRPRSRAATPSPRVREGPRTTTENGQPYQPYSMTWSATASSLSGTSRPSDFAVLRLMTSSYLIGCWIGRSVSLAPLRMRSMYPAAWRSSSEKSAL